MTPKLAIGTSRPNHSFRMSLSVVALSIPRGHSRPYGCLAAFRPHGRPRSSLPQEQINLPRCSTGQCTGKTA